MREGILFAKDGSRYYIESIAVEILMKKDETDVSKLGCRPNTKV